MSKAMELAISYKKQTKGERRMKKETKHGLKVFAGTVLLFGFGLLTLYALLKVG